MMNPYTSQIPDPFSQTLKEPMRKLRRYPNYNKVLWFTCFILIMGADPRSPLFEVQEQLFIVTSRWFYKYFFTLNMWLSSRSLEDIAILVATLTYLASEGDRRQRDLNSAWQVLADNSGKTGDGGRRGALEFLNNTHRIRRKPWFWLVYPRTPLSGVDVSRSVLRGVRLNQADLYKASFEGADLYHAEFVGANLAGAKFAKADLTCAKLNSCNSIKKRCNLFCADLRKAGLCSADLSGAYASSVDFREAILSQANLRSANLHAADLRGAYLANADLTGTGLVQADVRGVDFSEAKLSSTRFEGAYYSSTTKFPEGKEPDFDKMVKVDDDVEVSYAQRVSAVG